MNVCTRLCIAVLEGSCVDEPSDERNELCGDEILVALVLVDLRELVQQVLELVQQVVLEDVDETAQAAFTTTWSGEGLGPAESRLNSGDGPGFSIAFLKIEVRFITVAMLWKGGRQEKAQATTLSAVGISTKQLTL
jgi:hypothetical protein